MSKDKYSSTLLKPNGACCVCYPTIFCKGFELEHHTIIPIFADIDKGCR